MHENRAPFNLPEKLISEAMTFMRSLDETGDVGDDECLIVIRTHNTEVRDERCEGIVGDLWFRGADHRDQRRLAGIRQSDDPDVGDEFQLDEQLALFALLARLGKARRLAGRRGEVLIPLPAAPPFRHHDRMAVLDEIDKDFTGGLIANDGADRQLDGDVRPGFAGAVRSHPVLAATCLPLKPELEVVEGVEAFGSDDENRPACPAIPTRGTTLRDELLAAESNAAAPAVAGFDPNGGLVDKRHCCWKCEGCSN